MLIQDRKMNHTRPPPTVGKDKKNYWDESIYYAY